MVKKSVAALAALASLAATDAFMAPASVGLAPRRAALGVSPQRRALSIRGGATQAQMASFYDFELPLVGEWLSIPPFSLRKIALPRKHFVACAPQRPLPRSLLQSLLVRVSAFGTFRTPKILAPC